jgi:Flp pilus assembly protein TadD
MTKFCEQCGAPLEPDRKFCEECGFPVTIEPPASRVPPLKPAPLPPSPEPLKRSPSIPLPYILGGIAVVVIIISAVLLPGLLSNRPGEEGTPKTIIVPTTTTAITPVTQKVNATPLNTIAPSGDPDSAAEEINHAIAVSPSDDTLWVRKGFFEEGRKNYAEAITAFNKSIELAPAKNRWLLLHIGTDYNMLGQYEKALKIWDEIFALNYFDQANIGMHEVWNQKGRSLSGLGRYEEAVKAFDMAVSLYPEHEFALNSKGEALEKLGLNNEAAIAYQKALEINPTYEKAKINLANLQGN